MPPPEIQSLTPQMIYQDYINLLQSNNRHVISILSYIQNNESILRRLLSTTFQNSNRPNTRPTSEPIITPNIIPPLEPLPTQPNIIQPDALPRWTNVFQRPNLERFLASSPVRVAPTQLQIARASYIDFFQNMENPINSICPITQQPFNLSEPVLKIRHCGHIFTLSSITEWFNNNVRCPVCRHDIRNVENNNDNDIEDVDDANQESREQNTEITQNDNAPNNESVAVNQPVVTNEPVAVNQPVVTNEPIVVNEAVVTNEPISENYEVMHSRDLDRFLQLRPPTPPRGISVINEEYSNLSQTTLPETTLPETTLPTNPMPNITPDQSPHTPENNETPSNELNNETTFSPELQRELERNLLANLADTLNQELQRAIQEDQEGEVVSNNSSVNNRTLLTDPSGNIQYSFRFGNQPP